MPTITPLPLAPEGDSFYYPPYVLLEGEHGEVIWSRPLGGVAALAAAKSNEVVLYRSRDVHGRPIAVSGIVALPKADPPRGGYPVVSWAHGTIGSADDCAPSRDNPRCPAHLWNQHPHALLNQFLEKGWAVVMTDYEGLGTYGRHPYLLGESQARGILDIVRAARKLHPEISARLAIVGHSQGGQAALFGAHHAPTWTPELDLRCVAALAPASGIKDLFFGVRDIDEPRPGFAFTALFLTGAIAGDPSIQPSEVLTPEAYAVFHHVESRPRAGLAEPDSFGGIKGTNLLKNKDNPSLHALTRELERMHPNLEIHAPIRITQAEADERIWESFTTPLVTQLKTTNPERVEYRLYTKKEYVSQTHDPERLGYHFGTVETDAPELLAWVEAKLVTER
ncbi:lipase family protein [Polyangium sp. y55x31]|uniref:alpha/beta hydrolase n=1 Tax=Polyangium sp. y55x31 TaxID=3042688 RepID=UPI002482D17C|nr:lipase family protein [Polyangium sp. y55x31]MDI1478865.1 alpha/beta fold hydrolase [Polyangium sp. y55x31]